MLLADLVRTSEAVAATSSRLAKRDLIAALLAGAGPEDAGLAVAYLSGSPRQRRTGVGFAAIADPPAPAAAATLTLADVDAALDELGASVGDGSRNARGSVLDGLLRAATPVEQHWLIGLLLGGVRQGANESTVVDGLARAFGAAVESVRRAAMFAGGPVPVALALADGASLAGFVLTVGTPVQPMLAGSAPDVASALAKTGAPALLDTKLDGIRLQAHKSGAQVRLFTRSLDEVTERLPSVVAAVSGLPADRLVLDGEVIALGPDGRPRPFQETASATAESGADGLTYFVFDALLVGERVLLDLPLSERLAALEGVVPAAMRAPARVLGDAGQAQAWFEAVVAEGQEGLVVKDLASPYQAGRRGSGWVKVKPRHTLDLVVLAVERGNGRRSGYLSNIHLGARSGDGFVMLGKTFKGMTDAMLAWQTERFLDLADGPTDGYVVRVRPEQVVEVAFDGVQRSSRYPGGVALRFARVLRYRDDKSADQADTLEAVRGLLP